MRTTLWVLLTTFLLGACSGPPAGQAPGAPAPVLSSAAPQPMRLLIIGGTSGIGLQTAELALQRGHLVTALARRPERMPLKHKHLTTRGGNILDADAMGDAIRGQDAVVIAIGMNPTRQPVSLFSVGTDNVLAAMRANGVRRLVAVTGIGAGDSRGHGGFFYDRLLFPLLLKTIYEDKDRMEAAIVRTSANGDIDWTIVRPGFLTDDAPTHRYRVISELEGITASDITRADVAHFIVAGIEQRSHIGASPLISE